MSRASIVTRGLVATLACASLWLGGCSHPISLTADTAMLSASDASAPKIERKVGLLITAEQKAREVTTPGGGGDKVSYLPYRDLEVGLYTALSQVFSSVSRVQGMQDVAIQSNGLTLVISPEISTTSFSPSLATWPPTVFTVTLDCTVKDANAREVGRVRVQGEGRAEFDEFKSDFSLSAKRASTDAAKKLIAALREAAPSWR
jgi:hypothetical protein